MNAFFLILVMLVFALNPAPTSLEHDSREFPEELTADTSPESKKYIYFAFKEEPLANIVNMMAAYKNLNIILPADATFKNQKVTFKNDQEVTINQAFDIMTTFLDLAGYTIVKDGAFYAIAPTANNAYFKEVLPLYINIAPDNLPFSNQRIRALFYLSNLSVPAQQQQQNFGLSQDAANPISQILNDMTSPNSTIYDSATNAIIITDKANTIAAAMKIIFALDDLGVRETVEIIPLYNTTAKTVADFFKNSVLNLQQNQPLYGRPQRPQGSSFFSQTTQIISEDRTNSLIVLGRQEAVDRIREVIEEYIDVPPESGDSILHTYDLQYLDAESFSAVLNQIVNPANTPGGVDTYGQFAGQQSTQTATGSGPQRYFEKPIISYEKYEAVNLDNQNQQSQQQSPFGTSTESPDNSTGIQPLKAQQPPYQGGNRLIVAARKQDWEQIEALIKKLDNPQKQAIVYVLLIDCLADDTKSIESTIRNPNDMNLPLGVTFESANLPAAQNDALVYPNPFTTTSTLETDLLQFLAQNPGSTLASPPADQGASGPTEPGSTLITLTDPDGEGIWAALKILRQSTRFKVLSYPYLVVSDNQQATIQNADIRRDSGDPTTGANGVPVVPQIDITAALQINVTPRISSLDRANLQLNIGVSQFTSADTNTRTQRSVQTNLNMSTNQIVAFGGLAQVTHRVTATKTPPLANVPILGWFFKGVTQEVVRSNLLVLIGITIFEPHTKSVPNRYTNSAIASAEDGFSNDRVFDALRDPITRFFFHDKTADNEMANEYLDTAGSTGTPYRFTELDELSGNLDNVRRFCQPQPYEEYAARLRELVQDDENPLTLNSSNQDCDQHLMPQVPDA